MASRSTILDPYQRTVTIVADGHSRTYPYSTALATAKIADQLSPEIISLIVKSLAKPLSKSA